MPLPTPGSPPMGGGYSRGPYTYSHCSYPSLAYTTRSQTAASNRPRVKPLSTRPQNSPQQTHLGPTGAHPASSTFKLEREGPKNEIEINSILPTSQPPTVPRLEGLIVPRTGSSTKELIISWLGDGCPDDLDICCTKDVFTTTLKELEKEAKQGHIQPLPRLMRDYDPSTMSWYLRARPTQVHEMGTKAVRNIEGFMDPIISQGRFAKLSRQVEWYLGSGTATLPDGGKKEPDESIGMRGRKLPTIVIEVGYSETREKLRNDARRWLQAKDGKGNKVMLVILISFEGESTEEDDKPEFKVPESIWVELWRNRRIKRQVNQRVTRGNGASAPTAVRCERKRFHPYPENGDGNDRITLFASDIFGNRVRDPGNKQKWEIPVSTFKDAYESMLSVWRGDGSLNEDEVVVVSGSEDEEEMELSEDEKEMQE